MITKLYPHWECWRSGWFIKGYYFLGGNIHDGQTAFWKVFCYFDIYHIYPHIFGVFGLILKIFVDREIRFPFFLSNQYAFKISLSVLFLGCFATYGYCHPCFVSTCFPIVLWHKSWCWQKKLSRIWIYEHLDCLPKN